MEAQQDFANNKLGRELEPGMKRIKRIQTRPNAHRKENHLRKFSRTKHPEPNDT